MKTQIINLRKIFFIVVMIIFISGSALSQWKHVDGIYGGLVYTYFYNNGVLFAGTNFGLYKSIDYGENWKLDSENNIQVRDIKLYYNKIFIATSIGIKYSTNNGNDWVLSSLNIQTDCFEKNDSMMFAGTKGGLYVSFDSGLSWQLRSLNYMRVKTIKIINNDLLVSYQNNSFPYESYGIHKSTNNGIGFQTTNTNFDFISSITLINNELYAIREGYLGALKSIDGGNLWFLASLPNDSINFINKFEDKIILGVKSGFFLSSNNGVNWYQENNLNQKISSAILIDSIFILGSGTEGIYKFKQVEKIWKNVGINNGVNVTSIAKSESNLFAGTSRGLYLSTNGGSNWAMLFKNSNGIFDLAADNGNIIFSDLYSVNISTDNGQNWFSNLSGQFTLAVSMRNGISYAGGNNNYIYKSTNLGLNWLSYNLNTVKRSILDTLGNVFIGTENGIYHSVNGGLNWPNHYLQGEIIRELYFGSGKLYAGTYQNGLFVSENFGLNWLQYHSGGFNILGIEKYNDILFVTSNDGVRKLTNEGNNWTLINQGLPPNIKFWELLIYGNYLYACSDENGIWRRPLSEIVGFKGISSVIPEKYSLSQNYPNPFNPITKIRFNIPSVGNNSKSEVLLDVFDVAGKLVKQLYKGSLNPGEYEFEFNGSNLNSGVYFYRLQSDTFSETKKMVLVK